MESRLVNSASGNTIKVIRSPIRWLFNHSKDVVSFDAKILQDGGGLLIAQLDNGTRFRMTWASHVVMLQAVLKSRAWRNHFWQVNVYVVNSTGTSRITHIIK